MSIEFLSEIGTRNMKHLTFILCLASLPLIAGCNAGPLITVELTGSTGASVSGYYIRNGHRINIDDKLPITLSDKGITQVAIRKSRPEDELNSITRVGEDFQGGYMSMTSSAGSPDGIRLETAAGALSGSYISPEESLQPNHNSLFVISPYWYEGTWVFDDERTGLHQEPFVSGVPEMINNLVKNIPNAKNGFRLTFSTSPFPKYQKKLTWVKAQDGGNVYRSQDPPLEGWLCPAMFRYFTRTPKELYVRADPKD